MAGIGVSKMTEGKLHTEFTPLRYHITKLDQSNFHRQVDVEKLKNATMEDLAYLLSDLTVSVSHEHYDKVKHLLK